MSPFTALSPRWRYEAVAGRRYSANEVNKGCTCFLEKEPCRCMCNVGGAPLPGRAFLKHQKEEMPATGCVRWSETSQEGEAAPVASEDGVSLPLLVAKNRSGYFGVSHQTSWTKPYRAQLKRGGEDVRLGSFATAEEAALCVARSRLPEGQAAAEEAPRPLTPSNAEEGKGKPPAKPSIKEEGMAPLPSDVIPKIEEGVLPLMPSDARRTGVIIKEYEDERYDYQPKKQRAHY